RPGGVRRIIELATPHLLHAFGGAIKRVTLAAGEALDALWVRNFQVRLRGTNVEFFIESKFGYLSEQSVESAPKFARALQGALARLLESANEQNCIVWAHNLGLARNLLFTRELARACAQRGVRLIAHHHDWWFDNRWSRWAEMRSAGFRTLRSA